MKKILKITISNPLHNNFSFVNSLGTQTIGLPMLPQQVSPLHEDGKEIFAAEREGGHHKSQMMIKPNQ